MSVTTQPRWRAHPDCPDSLRYLIEKTVHAYPSGWIEEPQSGEIFTSIDECHKRLIAYSFSQGFDIVTTNSARTRGNATFSCIHHGQESRNTRGLPRNIERNKDGEIVGERKRELTVVRQTECT
jgi:hypothetical protein